MPVKEPAEYFESDKRYDRRCNADRVHAGSNRHADARGDPDAGGRRESVDGLAVHHDRTRR